MGKLILIADDYDDAAALLAALVAASSPYRAVAAKDGQEAIEKAEQEVPDVAILDIDMPRIDGISAARIFREIYGEKRPYLIALTGRIDTDSVALTGLFDQVLKKPAELERLLELIENG